MAENKIAKILIVEDEEAICRAYEEALKTDGFSVLIARNGQDGLDLAIREKPDLILLDILMPVMDGLTMMDKLRAASPYGKSVPIILLTNLSSDEERIISAVTKNEPSYYLVKSDWNLNQIVEKVKERLGRQE
ncbi:MAG: hypothetical protein A3F47_00500 [Candidatus Staskawiczbacteria bacterium RIFCSPHIGHO2_12_FULL_38_11]|uniref:Response regulatory domain-containing protein n=1 Tax=Candidatus Staskawiczbacteria bacterium RIFCSPHIGHO2_12_FULL_38_11 TaxID=1802209 RepID=A0A1G2I7R5_9BACT|nr:MAG: hypothetical protein A3F47_00500 [Candidatus Staskawiczbacteria bacterium RIFCSPHIGHO2_12_FULL_38_11]